MKFAALFGAIATLGVSAAASAAPPPNVLILFADDMGYADLSVTGNKQCPTPHIDSIAKNGVRFENSYVTGPVCSPSRAGLMSGRYQQRFGFDANAEGASKLVKGDVKGLDLSIVTFADHLKKRGYATGLTGKWHIGSDKPEYLPNARGFDEFYGLLPCCIENARGDTQMWRNAQPVATPADHTTAFADEAKTFIAKNKTRPWLLYCAFTAVHGPHVAPQKYLERFAHIAQPARRKYLAQLACLDDAIGGILETLRAEKLEENTLIFFASDNGGGSAIARNEPFRGYKWTLWEGGIRSPILIQWKGRIPAGRVLPQLTTQLDWLPTALSAAGAEIQPAWKLDGANLLPLLEGKTEAAPHEALFWRFGVQYAVRRGPLKLVKPHINSAPKLFDLAADPGEKTDLAAAHPAKVKDLQALWDTWNAANEPPRWIDHRWNGDGPNAAKNNAGKKNAAP